MKIRYCKVCHEKEATQPDPRSKYKHPLLCKQCLDELTVKEERV